MIMLEMDGPRTAEILVSASVSAWLHLSNHLHASVHVCSVHVCLPDYIPWLPWRCLPLTDMSLMNMKSPEFIRPAEKRQTIILKPLAEFMACMATTPVD